MKKIIETIPLILIAVVLPLILKPNLLLTWPVVTIVLYGVLLNLSQPKMSLKKESTDRHDRQSILLILIGALLCFIIPILDFAYGKSRMIELEQGSTQLALFMIWGGFLFRYWSIRVLGKFFSSKVEIRSDHQLINHGPYKYLRHPSYLGAWVSQVGIALLFQSVYGLVFSVLIYFAIYVYRIHCEEKALTETFPKEYPDYKKRTWGMLPYVF